MEMMNNLTEDKIKSYPERLRNETLPKIMKKIQSKDTLLRGIIDLSKLYCFKAELSEDKCNLVFEEVEKYSIPMGYSSEETKALSLFVLASVYYLTEVDAFTVNEIFIDNSGKLGFKESIDMFVVSMRNCDLFIDNTDEAPDIVAHIQQRLNLACGSCSIEEYFSNHIYINDLDMIQNVIEHKKSEEEIRAEELLKRANNQINITVKKIINTYEALFSSAYQVIKPVGLLTSNGIAKINSNGVLEYTESYELYEVYQYICSKLGYIEIDSRNFDLNLIVKSYTAGEKKKLYFPNKLLEFAFGCSSCSNKAEAGRYPAISSIKSWEDYESKIVRPLVLKICKSTIVLYFRQMGYLDSDAYKSQEAFSTLKGLMDCLYKNLTPCMIVSNWKEVADSPNSDVKSLVGFKFRVSDIDRVLPLNNTITEYIIDNVFGGLKGDKNAVCESIIPLGGIADYSVVDIQHKFSPTLVNGEPLFAYTALNALKNSGKKPSWKNLILGKNDNDSVLTVGDEISFNKRLCHWIIAGSRSGKGVMTLNILAGALASGLPVFYLDNKPDMASMFRSTELSGGRMFCVNGDYDASFDQTFGSCSPEQFRWDRNIPEYVRNVLGNDYNVYAPLFYLRAVMFLTCLIYVRGSVRTNKKLYDALGGKEGIVAVIDEISAADAGINAMFDKNGSFGSLFYSASTLANAENKNNQDKMGNQIVTQFGCYSTDLIRSLNESFRTICGQWKLKGLTGGGTEGDVSNIFIIGQNIHDVDTDKMEYIPTNDNNMNRMSGDAFYNFIFNLGNDAFMGYNVDHPEYMWSKEEWASLGSKSATRLNESARNFAYISNFDVATLNTMRDTKDASSRALSEKAKYFKPFLILNDAGEDTPYVAKDFKKFCDGAKLDFEKIKNMHRNAMGVLEPAIGFIPYVNAQSEGGESIQSTLVKSYDIANRLVKAYLPDYDGNCIDFIYDLRPEAMFTANSMLSAYRDGSHEEVSKLSSKFFGANGVQQYVEADFNIYSSDNDTFDDDEFNRNYDESNNKYAISPREQLRVIINEILYEHPDLRYVFTNDLVNEFIDFYFEYIGY